MKKVLVVHSVAMNGGDQLLFESLCQGLEKYCQSQVSVCTTNNLGSQAFINAKCVSNFDVNLWNHVHWRLNKLKKTYFSPFCEGLIKCFFKLFNMNYQKTVDDICSVDYAVLCPGGFIHEYYDYLYEIKATIELLQKNNIPIFIVGQSLGPFKERPDDARWILKHVKKSFIREKLSYEYVQELNLTNFNDDFYLTSDIALGYEAEPRVCLNNNDKYVFINLRPWKFLSEDELIAKGVSMALVILKNNLKVEFISTCQGLNGYTDDSILHDEIAQRLLGMSESFAGRIYVNRCRYQPRELINYLSANGSHFIGMRLHMTISSLLAGIPILNFGYEPKNLGVLNSIGLSEFYNPIQCSESKIETLVADFLNSDYENLSLRVTESKRIGSSKFKETFEKLNDELVF